MIQDTSHSLVRITYGTVKYVIDSIEDNTEIPANPQVEQVPQKKHKRGCSQVKGKSKNLNREDSLGRQHPYQYMKEDGLTLSHQNKILLRTTFEESDQSSST